MSRRCARIHTPFEPIPHAFDPRAPVEQAAWLSRKRVVLDTNIARHAAVELDLFDGRYYDEAKIAELDKVRAIRTQTVRFVFTASSCEQKVIEPKFEELEISDIADALRNIDTSKAPEGRSYYLEGVGFKETAVRTVHSNRLEPS